MGPGSLILLKERRFLPLFITQYFGAFNDNAFKMAMLTMISYHLSSSQSQSEWYQALAGSLFILPFFFLSATSGQLADKYDKALLTRCVKLFEVLLMILGSVSLFTGSISMMMLTLTGMGVHSAFFGPIKYAILPEHLSQEELLGATGLIEASTFLAILFGTILGTLSIGTVSARPYVAVILIMFAAISGFIASLFIPKTVSRLNALPINWHPWSATVTMLKQAKEQSEAYVSILTISWFWLIGTILLTKLPDYVHYVLGASPVVFAVFLALFSIGIALGSLIINRLLKGKITLSIVPYAMMVVTYFIIDLCWSSPTESASLESLLGFWGFFSDFSHLRIAFDLFMLAFNAGLFLVPLYTFLQIASNPENRARTFAANNIYNSLFMVLGTLFVMILLHFNTLISQVFLLLGLLNAFVAVFLWYYLKFVLVNKITN